MSDSLGDKTQKQTSAKKGSLMIGISLAVAVLALVAVVFFLLKTTKVVEPVALKVGDREVTRVQYDNYIELAKKTSTTPATVKQTVIQYEKNKAMADKYKLNIPDTYIELSRQDMLVAAGEAGGSSIEALRTANDDFTKLRLYNAAFDNFVRLSTEDGWGIILYDIPVIPSNDEAVSVARAQEQAKAIRAELVAKKITSVQAVEKAQLANIGQPAQTGMYFVRKSDGTVLSQYGGGVYTRLLDPTVMLPYLKDKPVGLGDVQNYEKKSVFFVDIMFSQKKRDNLPETIKNEQASMKVVDYVGK